MWTMATAVASAVGDGWQGGAQRRPSDESAG
jgi:hypothetical protein